MPTIIETLGISWRLSVQEFATLTYDHPEAGFLQYTGDVPWLCNNVNTLKLTSQGSLDDGILPPSVCIRPSYDTAGCGCDVGDENLYPVPADKCACADPGCLFNDFLVFKCDECEERFDGTVTKTSGGVNCPDSPAYQLEATLCGVVVKIVRYCCGGQWYADFYNDGMLCFTAATDNEKCPLVIDPAFGSQCAGDCTTGCIGGGTDCDDGVADDCCDTEPATTYLDVSSSAYTGTVTMTGGAGTHSWAGVDGGFAWTVTCSSGTWTVAGTSGASGCSLSGTASLASCDPIDVTFAGTISQIGTPPPTCGSAGDPFNATFME
jgi:hypothetical protein